MQTQIIIQNKKITMERDRAVEMLDRYDRLLPEMERIYPFLDMIHRQDEAQRRAESWALGRTYYEPRWLKNLRLGSSSLTNA